jgi:hypothetical protein
MEYIPLQGKVRYLTISRVDHVAPENVNKLGTPIRICKEIVKGRRGKVVV